jgi:hypothetical protein
MNARVWLTDGSPPVFSDTQKLRAWRRRGLLRVRYEGLVDPNVPRGTRELRAARQSDQLFVEAEWYVEFEGGATPYLEEPDKIDAQTPVIVQGMIEGKWLNLLLDTKRWQPASVGNNLIAEGEGISTTLGELPSCTGRVEVLYEYRRQDLVVVQRYASRLADLRGANVRALIREAVRACAGRGEAIDGVNLAANGPDAATVNDPRRLFRSLFRAGRLPLPDPRPHRAKERLVRRALSDEIAVPRGAEVRIATYANDDVVVGRGSLLLEPD